MQWRDKSIYVIHPLQLYLAKGHNVSELDQSDRQDTKHFAIMQLVLRSFLADLAGSRQEAAPKALLRCCESLIEFSLSWVGLKLILLGQMPEAALWPDLSTQPSEKIQNFARERMPRWEKQLASVLEKRRNDLAKAQNRADKPTNG